MTEYTVLWPAQPRSGPRPRGARLGGAADEQPRARVTHENLDGKQAAEAAATPGVRLAKTVRTKLIAPVTKKSGAAEDLWGVGAVGADNSPFDGSGCRVAVLDTGIDATHPAFQGVTIEQRDFTGEGDGDGDGHGTHCAGTIFGREVEGNRIGVAPGVEQAIIGKVLDRTGGGTTRMLYDGIIWAFDQRAHIISMSIGFDFPGMVQELVDDHGWPIDLATSDALVSFREHLGLFEAVIAQVRQPLLGNSPLIVAASGNESRRDLRDDYRIAASLPAAACDISVGAVGRDGARFRVAEFSNANPLVVAPGVDIVSALPGGGLGVMSGTSMACPHVAGIAALWAGRLRQDGEPVSAQSLKSYIEANTRRDVIVDFDRYGAVDVGRGLVSAPA